MLEGKVVQVEDLTVAQTKKMYSIMCEYYDNVIESIFYSDLLKKVEAVLLCDENNEIHGFTTLAIFLLDDNTQLLFSGDTIIEKEYWCCNNLSRSWINNAFSHAERFDGKTFWLLLTKGYKTYKFLPTFFNEFYPCVNTQTPPYIQEIIDKFSMDHFGDRYQNGVLVEGKDFLKDKFANIDEVKLKEKHTAFFLEKNPNYKNGDELICLCELSINNLKRSGRRALGK